MEIGKNIKAARKAAGLTQEQLAKKCGMAVVTIGQYERGSREPRQEQLQTLAAALGVHVLDLLGYPSSQKAEFSFEYSFSVEHMAQRIHKDYGIETKTAKCIVEDCYRSFQMNGKKETMLTSLAELFDSLDKDGQKSAIDYLKFLIQENRSEESSDES